MNYKIKHLKLVFALLALLLSGCAPTQGPGSSPLRIVKIESCYDSVSSRYLYFAEADSDVGRISFYDTRKFRVGSTVHIVVTEPK